LLNPAKELRGKKKWKLMQFPLQAKNAHHDVVHPYTTSEASHSKQPHSFPGTEAETSIHKPPFAQRHNRTGNVSGYSALFASPVKIISSPFNSALVALC
jgi:hypothetical protein